MTPTQWRSSIEQAKAESDKAARAWLDQVLSALRTFGRNHNPDTSASTSDEPVVEAIAFVAAAVPTVEGDIEESLTEVRILQSSEVWTVSPGDTDAWFDGAWLWQQLRMVTSVMTATVIPAGILLDLRSDTLAAWELLYCPDEIDYRMPDVIVPLSPEPEDEFDALMAEDDFDPAQTAEDLITLLDELNISVPADSAHSPGKCAGDEDLAEDLDEDD